LFVRRTKYESHISLVGRTVCEIRIAHQFGCLHGVRNTNHTSVWYFAPRTKYESHISLVVCTAYELWISTDNKASERATQSRALTKIHTRNDATLKINCSAANPITSLSTDGLSTVGSEANIPLETGWKRSGHPVINGIAQICIGLKPQRNRNRSWRCHFEDKL